ncbi:MAG: ABC transporter ATP-binding protein [Ignavibacteria bacterium]
MNQFAVEMTGITKTFGEGLKANDSVNFKVKKSEIHALVGENGAGKSTLMKILYGMYRPDSGTISVNESETVIDSPRKAISLGIGMVHQHFMLAGNLSVLENIILGDEATGFLGNIKYKECEKRIRGILGSFNIEIDLNARTENLPVGTQQKIEIIKLLYRNAEILILDEPTAVLTPQETDDLFRTLKKLKDSGKTIILITHKLGEVMQVSDSVTILRHGKVTGSLVTGKTTINEIAELIVGEKLESPTENINAPSGKKAFKVTGLTVFNDKKLKAVKDVSFDINSGEIFGIAGVEGNGQTELIEAICGLRRSFGEILLNGKKISRSIPIAHIPADRHKHGIVMEYRVSENIILGREDEEKFSSPFKLKENKINEYSGKLIRQYDIRPIDENAFISGLSGGNQQKVVVAREISKETDIIIVSHPTRGLDIKASNFVHASLLEESKKGKAILLVSSDLNELLKLCDRIAVIYNGEFNNILQAHITNEREIGTYMMGINNN